MPLLPDWRKHLITPACAALFLSALALPAKADDKASPSSACFSLMCSAVTQPENASADDEDDDDDKDEKDSKDTTKDAPAGWPSTYLDLSSGYSATPPGPILIGLRQFPLATSSSQSFVVAAPLTIDLTDTLSIFGGIEGATSRTSTTKWTPFTLGNWFLGFSNDLIQQSGIGTFPTLTLSGGSRGHSRRRPSER